MKFDTVIIGGGLSGLVCGCYLARQGQKCAIVSAGQSALHFSSGSFDLLNVLPDGSEVLNPLDVLDVLKQQAPSHPYIKLGNSRMSELTALAIEFFREAGIPVVGSADKNHYRVTPMGTLKPTWLSLADYAISGQAESLPWKKVALFNIAGFLDFQTQFMMDEFKKMGTTCTVHLFNMKALENIRRNPTEMRSSNIAKVFENEENLKELGEILKHNRGDAEVVLLPAVLELIRTDSIEYLKKVVGVDVKVLPTMPPSVPGIHVQLHLKNHFQKLGGVYMLGDNILRADLEGDKVLKLYSYNHGNIPFSAENFVLATGSFFSKGLIATFDRIYEPVFDLPVPHADGREHWYNLDFFATQAYQSMGVQTDGSFRAVSRRGVMENLYAVGAVLDGFNALKEGCGAGVSILTALEAGRQIMAKSK